MTKLILKGKAYWAELTKPNKFSQKYEIKLADLDPESVDALEKAKVELKTAKENQPFDGVYIVAKSKEPVKKVFDKFGNPWDMEKLIGNGSQVELAVNIYPWDFQGRSGMGVGLNAVKVVDLVEFGKETGFSFEKEAQDDIPF